MRIILAALIALVTITVRCAAQEPYNILPGPITAAELKRYGDLLGLSHEQRVAADTMHDRYREEFQKLREGEIADLLNRNPGLASTRAFISGRAELATKIQAIDGRFFDELQTILTERQLEAFPLVRHHRQRQSWLTNFFPWNWCGQPVDVVDIFLDLEPSPEQISAASGILLPYDATLTSHMAKIERADAPFFRALFAELDRQGIRDEKIVTHEIFDQIEAISEPLQIEHGRPLLDVLTAMRELNRGTIARLAAGLPADAARKLRLQFIVKSYPNIWFAGMGATKLHAALKRQDITAEQRDAIHAAIAEFDHAFDQLVEEGMRLIDEFRRTQTPFVTSVWNENSAKHVNAMRVLYTKAFTLREQYENALNDILGTPAQKPIDLADVNLAAIDPMDRRQRLAANGIVWLEDVYLQSPIGLAELNEYAAPLQLTDAQRESLNGAHREYIARTDRIRDNQIKTLEAAKREVYTLPMEQVLNPGATPDTVNRFNAARQTAIQATHAADQWLLDQIEGIAADPAQKQMMPRIRLARQRQLYNRGSYGGRLGDFGPGHSNEANLDLAALLRRLALTQSVRASIDPILKEYEEALVPMLHSKFDAALQYDAGLLLGRAEYRQKQFQTGQTYIEMTDRFKELTGPAQTQLDQANDAICKLNRETSERVRAALPADAADQWQRTYERLCHPKIYSDPACIDGILNAALRLPDLSGTQRTQIENLCAEYRPAYAEACKRLIDSLEKADSPEYIGGDQAAWNQNTQRTIARGKIAFQRHELSVTALHKLRGILLPAQTQSLGGLPDPPEPDWREDNY